LAGPSASTTDETSNLRVQAATSDAAMTMASSQTSVVWLDLKVGSPRPRLLEHRIVA
jgi:hypothetical protein